MVKLDGRCLCVQQCCCIKLPLPPSPAGMTDRVGQTVNTIPTQGCDAAQCDGRSCTPPRSSGTTSPSGMMPLGAGQRRNTTGERSCHR
eukprot:s1862_g4.t1